MRLHDCSGAHGGAGWCAVDDWDVVIKMEYHRSLILYRNMHTALLFIQKYAYNTPTERNISKTEISIPKLRKDSKLGEYHASARAARRLEKE